MSKPKRFADLSEEEKKLAVEKFGGQLPDDAKIQVSETSLVVTELNLSELLAIQEHFNARRCAAISFRPPL